MTGNRKTQMYKVPEEGKVMGVCAGVADHFQANLAVVRVFTFFGILFSGLWPGLLVYVILGFVLEAKPRDLYEDSYEETFWRETKKDPSYTASEIRRRFRDIERRTRDMEAYMTSKRFKLERDLRDLER